MNKKKLYESIMSNVAKEVKKALSLNEAYGNVVKDIQKIAIKFPLKNQDALTDNQKDIIKRLQHKFYSFNNSSERYPASFGYRDINYDFLILVPELEHLKLERITNKNVRWISYEKLCQYIDTSSDVFLGLIFVDPSKSKGHEFLALNGDDIYRADQQLLRQEHNIFAGKNIPGRGEKLQQKYEEIQKDYEKRRAELIKELQDINAKLQKMQDYMIRDSGENKTTKW